MIPGNKGRMMRDSKRRRLTRIYDDEEQQVLESVMLAVFYVLASAHSHQILTVRVERGPSCKVHMKML